jgi:hypothetical protein
MEVLKRRCFGEKWVMWIGKILHNGSVGVHVNNSEKGYIETGKGLRQGDPWSPIHFNIVVDVLTRMLQVARNQNLIKDLGENIVEQG